MGYSAFNPTVWSIFLAFVLVVWVVVRVFALLHPDYPVKGLDQLDTKQGTNG
jgi:hypothetical protein